MTGAPDGLDEVMAALTAEPEGRVFLHDPASEQDVDAFERDSGLTLPDDVRHLLLWSDGVGVARSPVGFFLPPVAGLRRLNDDDLYTAAFPGMLLVADDGASGLFAVDVAGSSGHGRGAVLLTDRGSLRPQDTAVVGASVTEVLTAVLAAEDLWRRPRLAAEDGS